MKSKYAGLVPDLAVDESFFVAGEGPMGTVAAGLRREMARRGWGHAFESVPGGMLVWRIN